MGAPHEIILAAADIWTAPVGTAFPLVDVAPAVAWIILGKAGSLNRSEDGVTLTLGQELFDVRVDGSAYPVKQGRLTEEATIAMTMYDLTLEQLRIVFNQNTVTASAGPPPTKSMSLERGSTVANFAMLMRNPSPYNDAENQQWEFYKVSNRGASEIAMRRTAPAGIRIELTAQADNTRTAGDFVGRVIADTTTPP
jgi:hypothetical protein